MFEAESAPEVPEICSFAIGESFPYDLPHEGSFLMFGPSGPTVVFNIEAPDEYEKSALRAGHPTRIGLLQTGRLGWLLFNFGEGFVFDVPFDAGIEPPDCIVPFHEFHSVAAINKSMPLLLLGVDSSTGKVFGIRLLTPSNRISSLFVKKVLEQALRPITLDQLRESVVDAYKRYPSVKAMIANAVGMDKAG